MKIQPRQVWVGVVLVFSLVLALAFVQVAIGQSPIGSLPPAKQTVWARYTQTVVALLKLPRPRQTLPPSTPVYDPPYSPAK
jgi:hypothetical protein